MEVAAKGKAKRRHLNAAESEALGQSAEGTSALTQPHSCQAGRGSRDPNRGLYPRTPTKRRKCAAASGSPAGQQRSISDFFSVNGVLRSSPQKSPQPCSSRSVGPRPNPEPEDEDQDDVSLLAAPLAAQPHATAMFPGPRAEEEEEIDDASLLAAAEEEEEEEEEVDSDSMLAAEMLDEDEEPDYLEGMTAEMFGVDDDFDSDACGEGEEVEALPDAHYGLLGSGGLLLRPRGCMEDLPEEVLRKVLSHLPAQDLYRSTILVCHRWRNIVQDPKFVPHKKQYYRYMLREKETMLQVFSVLRTSGVTDLAASQHSIRHLVVVMAQHKVGEWVSPDDVLRRVRRHRLFPQAEAAIRLRIPDIQKYVSLGTEGPNPYAAMAVILILSESVADVQALVSLLDDCMSHTAITEYLNHMATMLLALKRSNIQISNRVHYNIYYVLHLMENGPFPVGSSQSGRPQIQLTHEQQHILSHDIQQDHVVKIIAFAGTGKTTTLVKFAEQRPHLRFLYVSFNKAVANEARRRFPRNVDCKTVHSLAFKDVGREYFFRKKVSHGLKPFAINRVLPQGRGGFTKAKVVLTTLHAFMASPDPSITTRHVPSSRVTHAGFRDEIKEDEKQLYVRDAQDIWNKMKDLNETTQDAYYMTHDGYLKLWQLRNPKPCLSDSYDVLFIDEAQDCTPATLDVLLSQRCSKILVGDPHQQIYTFRGAVNALDAVSHTHIYYLTQSFRFGAEIAYVGATILAVCKSVQKILVGGKQRGGVCDETAGQVAEAVRTGESRSRGTTAILARSNFTVFSMAVKLMDANPRCRIHIIGNVQSMGLDRIQDIWQLMQMAGQNQQGPEQPKLIRDRLIRSFARKSLNPLWALRKYIQQTEDVELMAKLNIVETYTSRIPELVARLESSVVHDICKADFIVGTVHKAKGLEFETVMVTDDFAEVPASRHNLHHNPSFSFSRIPDDEWNLLYVAVTRAKTLLIITETIRRILTVAGEYFLKSETSTSLMKVGEPLPCSIPNCPNCITPGSAFIMCKQEMKLADGVSPGGPLCERCVWTRIGPTAFLMTDDVLSMAEIPERLGPPVHQGMLMGLF